ncbi:MAG: DUF456 domain-containing protein [Mariniphaga sp.]|nr:DUF456 domain-containing protein [Mariniphaga sp.]MDD4226595.1 DUF456 domain-containing protein [Mariniphaga sp.]MDD4425207.1 DUF456 domain-containing protein [Mariniphaga sp.]
MDILLIIAGVLLMVGGILGGVLPVLPGPPLSYAGLICLHLTGRYQFSSRFLIIWAVVTAVVYLLDYLIPVWGTKRFGGSKRGVWGSVIGLVIGLFFFPPFGIIAGPFLGAVAGELSAGKDSVAAMKSGFGSFVGFLAGTLIKLVASGLMAWHFARVLFLS